ncbi:MAG: hypothetical protein H0V79_12510 [Actinobacteria bacterium]|nr:hypothetical protein [Actinomycetota bacterium]
MLRRRHRRGHRVRSGIHEKDVLAVLEPDDRVEPAGYPNALQPITRILRGDDILATVAFRRNGVPEAITRRARFAPEG